GARPDVQAVTGTISCRHVTGVVAARSTRIELDRAADGVSSGECTLRSAQDFDAVEIEQVHDGAGQCREIDVVDVDPGARLEGRAEVGGLMPGDHRRITGSGRARRERGGWFGDAR